MFTGVDFVSFIRSNPTLAVFFTVAVGFLIGKLRWRSFTLGTVTSVLLVGVAVGQFRIEVPEPAKTLFFLMFLFAVGYAVGPQFFRGLKKDGLPQVGFAVVVCLLCLGSAWMFSKLMHYTLPQAAGLLAGSQTMSAVLGVATDTIRQLPEGADMDLSAMPVCYAVTYIFGTAGSAWILGTLGPRLLGGVDKVKAAAREMESKLGQDMSNSPGFDPAAREIVFRAFRVDNPWFDRRRTVREFEQRMQREGKRIFVERICRGGRLIDEVTPRMAIRSGDGIVLSGRRQYVIEEEEWIGQEIVDDRLTDFSIMTLPVVVNRKGAKGCSVGSVLAQPYMHGVGIRSVTRAGAAMPVYGNSLLDAGDRILLVGLPQDVRRAADDPERRPPDRAGHLSGRVDLRVDPRGQNRSHPPEPDRQRRRADRRTGERLAAVAPPHARGHPRADGLVHEQHRTEHLHRHRRDHHRPDVRAGFPRGGLEPLSGGRRSHLRTPDPGYFHR